MQNFSDQNYEARIQCSTRMAWTHTEIFVVLLVHTAQRPHLDEAPRHVLCLEHRKRLVAQGAALVALSELAAHHQALRVLNAVVLPMLLQELHI